MEKCAQENEKPVHFREVRTPFLVRFVSFNFLIASGVTRIEMASGVLLVNVEKRVGTRGTLRSKEVKLFSLLFSLL